MKKDVTSSECQDLEQRIITILRFATMRQVSSIFLD